MLPIAVGILVGLCLSAFATVAELAVYSLGDSRVRTLVGEGFRGSDALAELRAQPRRLVALLRLTNVLGNIAAGGLAAFVAYQVWRGWGLALVVGLLTVAFVILAELLPMRLAVRQNVRIALMISPLLLLLSRVLASLLFLIERVGPAIPARPVYTIENITQTEIRQLTELGHVEGVIEEHERQIIERAFRLDETKAWDIMTPRVDIFAWRDALTLAEIATHLGTVPYSRVPVFGESIDDITGVLYLRDAYKALVSGMRDVPLKALAREPLIVPGSVSLTKLLRDFQTRRIHLALVVDEYGGTDGLVTLEDVLEELVGEIVDETDVTEEAITRVSRNELLAAGDADLREINHFFNTDLPLLEHRSLNGYLLDELGRVPQSGENLEHDDVLIEVLEATETQVLRARLRRRSAVDGAAPPPPSPSLLETVDPAEEPAEEEVRHRMG